MKWQLLVCLFAGVTVAAASNSGWKDGTEYVYQVRGRMLSGYPDLNNKFTGILIGSKLTIQARKEGLLIGRLSDARYAQVHTEMPNGWRSEILDSQLSYQPIPFSDKPFQIEMKNGVVKDIQVDKEIPNWEANMIRSVISQIQLDTKGENAIKSRMNQFPDENSFSAVYKTMEETVTGKHETLYELKKLPNYILTAHPWLVPLPNLAPEGEVYEIVKTRNYSNSEHMIGYHYGFSLSESNWEPFDNDATSYLSRSSLTRAVITGRPQNYAIQSSVTTNEIYVLLNGGDSGQKGLVVSQYNLTLASCQSTSSQLQHPSSPTPLGSLVYRYDLPYASDNKVRSGPRLQRSSNENNSNAGRNEDESKENSSSDEDGRHSHEYSSSENSENADNSESYWRQQLSQMSSPLQVPLMPYTTGYKGQSIKRKVNAADALVKLAEQIGQELNRPDSIPREQTLGKFIQMSHLVQILNDKELQEVTDRLYIANEKGAQKNVAWSAFRDAVAESGTPPALLAVQSWIMSGKIAELTAAAIVSQLAQSTRVPSEEYMRTFYVFTTKPQVQSQAILNDTALLAFANLVGKVYSNPHKSHNMFPVHAFGKFATANAQNFVENEYIPFLKKQLDDAMSKQDKHQSQIYIRALGNTAHPKMLQVFQPYLEGQLPATNFQRFQMVTALNKLARNHPKLARAPLYKMYQNIGELPQLRVAAVYQLMRTGPPASMLQRMAEYTNYDPNEQVNAAVKSSIEYAAEMTSDRYRTYRENARAARYLLNPKTYGLQYSQNYLRDYVSQEMNMGWQQSLRTVASYNSYLPKYVKYSNHVIVGQDKLRLLNFEMMVNSVNELGSNVLRRVQKSGQEERQNSYESNARKLNIRNDDEEELDGSIYLGVGDYERYFTFDKDTIRRFIEASKELEEELAQGKSIHYSKFFSGTKMHLAVPSDIGLSVLWSLDNPTTIDIRGQLSVTANPKIVTGNKLQKPDYLKASGEISAVFVKKVQSQVGFVTPFDSKHYIVGYDKDMQVNLPLKVNMEIGLKKEELHVEIEAIEPEKDRLLGHYSTSPYTSKHDILRLQPVGTNQDTHKIRDESAMTYKQTMGEGNGMVFKIESQSTPKHDLRWFSEQFRRHRGLSFLMAPWMEDSVRSSYINIIYVGSKSTNRKLKVRMAFKDSYQSQASGVGVGDGDGDGDSVTGDVSSMSQSSRDPTERLDQFYKKAAAGIHSAQVTALDGSIELTGGQPVEYRGTLAYAGSSVDKNSRMLMHINKHSANEPYEISFSAKGHFPNTNGLDPVYAIEFDPTSTIRMHLAFGKNYESSAKIDVHAKLRKSEERKQYLLQQPAKQLCDQEMKQGNKQLPACANLTANANLMDKISVQIQHQNVPSDMMKLAQHVYDVFYHGNYLSGEETIKSDGAKKGQVDIDVAFSKNFDWANASLTSENREATFKNIRIGGWLNPLFKIHPVFTVKDRYLSKIFDYQMFKPSCVVDQTAAATFDNRTFPVRLGNDWTVMMIYAPYHKHSMPLSRQVHTSQQRQLAEEHYEESYNDEDYMILIRDYKGSQAQKEVKMFVQNSDLGKPLEISMMPAPAQSEYSGKNPKGIVTVNGQQQQLIDDQKSADIANGQIQIYSLANGELKVDLRGIFYILYDGSRARISLSNFRFRNSVRGLCGPYNSEPTFDYRDPQGCQLSDAQQFVAAYRVEAMKKRQQTSSEQNSCWNWEIIYGKYITDENDRNSRNLASCSKYQTRYVTNEDSNEVCFTIRPLPVCKDPCKPTSHTRKNVAVHCVKRNTSTQLWTDQINKGASPDFSNKPETRRINMNVTKQCST